MNYLSGPLPDRTPGPARSPAQVFLDLEAITDGWAEYEVLTSLSGDRWHFRPRGDDSAPWAEAGSAAEVNRAITADFTDRPVGADEQIVVVARGGQGRWRR